MPDQTPAATENTPVRPNDADTAATVLTGSDAPATPGGGGLGPRSVTDPVGPDEMSGTAPNAVIDVPTPAKDDGELLAGTQARADTAHTAPGNPEHESYSASNG